MHVIGGMTAHAGSLQFDLLGLHFMTGVAVELFMRPAQRKFRPGGMVKKHALPLLLVVAGRTVLTKTARMSIIGAMTTNTSFRYRHLGVTRSVTGRTGDRCVNTVERKVTHL